MEEESHIYPLAPARIHQRSDEEFAPKKPDLNLHKQQRSSKCLVYLLVAIVFLSIALLIFSLAVLRVSTPKANITTVSITNLTNVAGQSPSLSATMIAAMNIKNDNFGGFELENSDTKGIVLYGNVTIGDMWIGLRRVAARTTERVNVTVNLSSNELVLGDENFGRDVNSGVVNIISYAELRGELRVMNMVKTRRTVVMNCSMSLDLTSRAIQDLFCL